MFWHKLGCHIDEVEQWSQTFLTPGTGFVEDNISLDVGGLEMIQAPAAA